MATTKSATFDEVSRRSGKLPIRYSLASLSSRSVTGSRVIRTSSSRTMSRTLGTSAVRVCAETLNEAPYFPGLT